MKYRLFFLIILMLISNIILAEEKPIITVLDFNTNGVSENEMIMIISLLSSSLFQTEKYTVIDVSERETLLNEMEFSIQICTDESCQLKIGQMLSAEAIVLSIGQTWMVQLQKKY